jgi:hypothetical protein
MTRRNRLLDYAYWRTLAAESRAAAAKSSDGHERQTLEHFAQQYEKLAAYGESCCRAESTSSAD